MDVVDHETAAWYLLADGDAMFLDVNCEGNAAGYSLLLELTADERRAFALEGRAAIERIALEVAALPEDFWDRQVLGRSEELSDAVRRFRGHS